MHAVKGERLVVHAAHVGDAARVGEILEVRGEDGQPPYLVKWSGNGHTALFFPSSDAYIDHKETPDSSA